MRVGDILCRLSFQVVKEVLPCGCYTVLAFFDLHEPGTTTIEMEFNCRGCFEREKVGVMFG